MLRNALKIRESKVNLGINLLREIKRQKSTQYFLIHMKEYKSIS